MKSLEHLQAFRQQGDKHVINHEQVFDGAIFQVHRIQIHQGNHAYQRDLVHKLPAVGILATDANQRVVLISQWREAVAKDMLEIPAGLCDIVSTNQIEDPLTTAKRELQEECSLVSNEWTGLNHLWTSPGFTDERMHLFRAKNVQLATDHLEAEDQAHIQLHWYDKEEIIRLIRSNDIGDMKTVLALTLWIQEENNGTI